MLQEITGTADFTVRGAREQLSAEIEGLVLIPEKNLYHRSRNFSGLLIVTTGADGTRKMSGSMRTTGDLGRELERLKNN